MRKIIHHPAYHNIAGTTLPLLLVCILTLSAAGCGNKAETNASSGQQAGTTTGQTTTAAECGIRVNIKPWLSFQDMAARMSAGQDVPRTELEAYCVLPAVAAWRQSLEPNELSVVNLTTWLEGTWWNEMGRQGKRKVVTDGIVMGRNYRYSHKHRAQIDELIAEFTTGNRACDLQDLNAQWLRPENIQTPLVLNFLPAMAEIRIFANELYIDTGVLQAGGSAQTMRHVASLLYRNLEAVAGTPPLDATGEQAVAECLRVVMNEGVISWIEKTVTIEFDQQHPALRGFHVIPEDLYRKAQYAIGILNEQLPDMLNDAAVMSDRGLPLARTLAAGNLYGQTGLAMAQVIASRLGEERLHQVSRSVPDFVAAYQEAALLNPVPIPEPGAMGIELFEAVPPLDPAVFDPLHALLQRHFAAR